MFPIRKIVEEKKAKGKKKCLRIQKALQELGSCHGDRSCCMNKTNMQLVFLI